ncbi:amidase [Paenibacillus sp. NEAU-GSW1]|uniref:amidase n=1 Tax=Paenibacillus sp. NEAU-GSW1 TaxID=2682486 RepID=UPI0012E28148|nr:amidase [Paenibacillus sp. NEAU-GSW1]MUT66592.1 amidase [Paenibacillus sp. NEAU-GSW1]
MKDAYNGYARQDVVLEPTGKGPLDGLTFAAKDVFAVKGHTNGAGNPDWLRTHAPADATAPTIERLLASGARLSGMTHTDELMYSINGQNVHYGTPINPKAPGRIPGGSSSGSAVAVAAGMADFALGTDTGGSVRVPSSYCGIYGFRPTHGWVTAEGVIPLAPSFDTVGWMARDAEMLLRVGEALLGAALPAGEGSKKGFGRLLFAEDAWGKAEAESAAKLLRFRQELEAANEYAVSVQSVNIAPEGLEEWIKAFRTAQALEIWETHGEWIESVKPVFGGSIGERFVFASKLKPADHEPQLQLWRTVRARMRELLGEDGLLVIPTVPGTAPDREVSGEAVELGRFHTMQLCCIAGLSGLPQITLPAGEVDGAPIGLSFIAGAKQDLKLLKWARQFAGRMGERL